MACIASAVSRIRVSLLYVATLVISATVMLRLDPDAQDRLMCRASTNLHNLGNGHVGTLLGSAFILEPGPIYVWAPGLLCLLALAELMWRSGRLMVGFAVGHIGATLLVAVGLTAAVQLGWLPEAVDRATDVGMSCGAAAVLGTLTAAIPGDWQKTWIGWWLSVAVAAVYLGQDFTNVGHAVALLLGMTVSVRFGAPRGWTPVRCALLAAASMFALLLVGLAPM